MLTHLSLQHGTKHAAQNNPARHTTDTTTGGKGGKSFWKASRKRILLQPHLKRRRAASTDITFQPSESVTVSGPASEGTGSSACARRMTATSAQTLVPLARELPGSSILATQKRLRCREQAVLEALRLQAAHLRLAAALRRGWLQHRYGRCQGDAPKGRRNRADKQHGWPERVRNKPARPSAPTSKSHLCHK